MIIAVDPDRAGVGGIARLVRIVGVGPMARQTNSGSLENSPRRAILPRCC
jgi:hypothetical protein